MATKKSFSYKESITEIESLIKQIDDGELEIDEISEKVKRAALLIKKCKEMLKNTEQEIYDILKENE